MKISCEIPRENQNWNKFKAFRLLAVKLIGEEVLVGVYLAYLLNFTRVTLSISLANTNQLVIPLIEFYFIES